ncbi:unnamed protein product [Euphydryas editha]|uniref:Fucosyltransferase n=1 Tax=Euphydryas editha TaxID=104508 RepID=A0AAU9V2I1_EUPED|nr:unnamed protein product [Euphydryas editha]
MKWNLLMKTFFYVSMVALLIFLYNSLREFKNKNENSFHVKSLKKSLKKIMIKTEEKRNFYEKSKMKYILQWSSPNNSPFVYMGVGQSGFIERNCTFTNCFVTSDRNYFDDYTKFDVIAFNGPDVVRLSEHTLPKRRSVHQKFVFGSIESPHYYPVCSNKLDNFFNWTWTYKVTSDARWGYMVVRDSNYKVIGPNVEMHWMKKVAMAPVSVEFKEKLKTKTKAAAWFVSNCYSRSGREQFVKKLKEKLKKHKLSIDIYGDCGTLKCPRKKQDECTKMIERDYYFYLSFENSFAEDYVTEKLLYPLQNNAVPIVYGGANYTR